jgi:GWxTD domain-containing protein
MAAKGLWVSSISISAAGLIVLLALPAVSQDTTTPPATKPAAATPPKRETVAKPLTDKERKKKEAALKKELETPWRKWINEDVTYIITDEERKAFKGLNTDEERESFVEQFWLRRDPTPDTVENEYKEEHYRRIAYTNEHYASGIPGWKTDRGRIYITYGPPDEIDSHPSGGSYDRPDAEGGGTTSTYPFEDWRYRYIEGIGNDINIEFVDTTMSGEYHMTMDPSEKDALLYVPGAGLTMAEQMGLSDKTQRFNRTDGTHMGDPIGGPGTAPVSYNEFERIGQFAKLGAPPVIKYKDLESAITSRITYNVLPMQVRVDYVRVTDSSVLANVTIQFENKDMQFQAKDGVQKSLIEMIGRVSTMTRRPVTTFETPLEIIAPTDMLQKYAEQRSIYQKSIPLAPGRYKLNIVAKDRVGGNMANYETALDVPHFEEEKLASSSLILADLIERLPKKSIGGVMFAISDTKVRPRLGDKFTRDEKLGIYLQFYNFNNDEKTKRPSGSIDYEIVKAGTTDKVLSASEDLSKIPNSSASQVTVEKLLSLKSLEPGTYTLKVKATDTTNSQTTQQQRNFIVSQ